MWPEAGRQRSEYTHVIQIQPEEGATSAAGPARRYMESYFGSARMSVYWGRAEAFLKELREAWAARR